MFSYILKRLLLMIPTLIGVLTVTFAVIQFVPGGPVEQMVHDLRETSQRGDVAGMAYRGNAGVDPQQIAALRVQYGFDKPPVTRAGVDPQQIAALRVQYGFDKPPRDPAIS